MSENVSRDDLDRRSGEFLSRLVHELRNPLASLAAASRLLSKAGDRPEIAAAAREALERQVGVLADLLSGLSEASHVASGRISLKEESQDLLESISAGIDAARPLIEQQKGHLAVDLPAVPFQVKGDRVRLRQIFTLLLSDAARSLEAEGTLRVSAHLDADEIEINVSYPEAALEAESLSRVFDFLPASKVSNSSNKAGFGFELPIVRALVEQQHGSIAALNPCLGEAREYRLRFKGSRASAGQPAP